MMCYAGVEDNYGNQYHMLDMGVVSGHDWMLLDGGVRATNWVALPGMCGSFIRLREARPGMGECGLAMFP